MREYLEGLLAAVLTCIGLVAWSAFFIHVIEALAK